MEKVDIEKRVLELQQALEQSVGNHNALLGRLAEAQHLLGTLFGEEVKSSQGE